MTKKFTVAVLAGLVALSVAAGSAFAQCGTGVLIDWDADSFSYETNYSVATFNSVIGSELNVVGIVNLFCGPLSGLNALDPAKEYTFYFDGMISEGTVHSVVGPTAIHTTEYNGGTFSIYEGTPRNAPTAAGGMPINPPNATVPANFTDGTLILTGNFVPDPSNNNPFTVRITKTGTNPANGSFRGNYQFTGGSLYGLVDDYGVGLLQGLWCVTPGCTPTGYSGHPDAKFDEPTPATSTTWGAIKQLYR